MEPLIRPVHKCASVTPSNTTAVNFRAIYVGVTGDLVYTDMADSEITLANLAAGVWHPIEGKLVKTTSTVTNIVACLDKP